MVFNPSSMIRLAHVLIGAFILGAFFVMSISAWYLLTGRHAGFARRSLTGGLLVPTIWAFAALGDRAPPRADRLALPAGEAGRLSRGTSPPARRTSPLRLARRGGGVHSVQIGVPGGSACS